MKSKNQNLSTIGLWPKKPITSGKLKEEMENVPSGNFLKELLVCLILSTSNDVRLCLPEIFIVSFFWWQSISKSPGKRWLEKIPASKFSKRFDTGWNFETDSTSTCKFQFSKHRLRPRGPPCTMVERRLRLLAFAGSNPASWKWFFSQQERIVMIKLKSFDINVLPKWISCRSIYKRKKWWQVIAIWLFLKDGCICWAEISL